MLSNTTSMFSDVRFIISKDYLSTFLPSIKNISEEETVVNKENM